ncbi:uncharacterized protein UV8b_07439 [Ustilaginoidea virens]|uniref:Arginase-like protein n=1 Tax=Ustilaginoidea virens TaxID=1159556 RepID=A0A1B5KTS6_USTVR|nr:uncharacterized protein UV8b_07439 [Ustilaginoidea virens]QUC23198.1 hypothetical protein UV8b_07439 [Ustilaginoidea virens]GAO14284.1 hypothetical protein UVI_02033630 [Ustilaginoidea virens]
MKAASALTSSSIAHPRRAISHIRTYNWPPLQLNFWIFVMLISSASIVGVFSTFVQIQLQLNLPIPWYFPYYITVGCIALLFIGGIFWLIANRRLLPAIVMIGAFVLFVMWLVGLVVVSVQLWGPDGSIQSTCSLQVFNRNPHGLNQETLAWLQQKNICQSWHLIFAMGLTGLVFLVWVMIMAYQVFVNS